MLEHVLLVDVTIIKVQVVDIITLKLLLLTLETYIRFVQQVMDPVAVLSVMDVEVVLPM